METMRRGASKDAKGNQGDKYQNMFIYLSHKGVQALRPHPRSHSPHSVMSTESIPARPVLRLTVLPVVEQLHGALLLLRKGLPQPGDSRPARAHALHEAAVAAHDLFTRIPLGGNKLLALKRK